MATNRVAKLFELYKGLGPNRTLVEVSEISGVDITTVQAFAEAGDWELHIQMDLDRDKWMTEARELADEVVALQKTLFKQINTALSLMDTCTVGLPFDIQSARDFSAIAKAYETLVKAALIAKEAFAPDRKGDVPESWFELVKEVFNEPPQNQPQKPPGLTRTPQAKPEGE